MRMLDESRQSLSDPDYDEEKVALQAMQYHKNNSYLAPATLI